MAKEKLDTRAIGLDVGLQFVRWLTGAENLHYGYWDGLDVNAANLKAAQENYTEKLFRLLPASPARILDIGGGAGETARKLLDLGHEVEIVVPSELLAERCRNTAPGARVHECMFEDYSGTGEFDLCLFSESYQYIPLSEGIPRCLNLLRKNGHIIISDCFRSEQFSITPGTATVGGGHLIAEFRSALSNWSVDVLSEEDITKAVAPSVEIEQGLFNVLGYALTRVDDELQSKKPKARWALEKLINVVLNERKRSRLDQRLNQQTRNREVFQNNNIYLMMLLEKQN